MSFNSLHDEISTLNKGDNWTMVAGSGIMCINEQLTNRKRKMCNFKP